MGPCCRNFLANMWRVRALLPNEWGILNQVCWVGRSVDGGGRRVKLEGRQETQRVRWWMKMIQEQVDGRTQRDEDCGTQSSSRDNRWRRSHWNSLHLFLLFFSAAIPRFATTRATSSLYQKHASRTQQCLTPSFQLCCNCVADSTRIWFTYSETNIISFHVDNYYTPFPNQQTKVNDARMVTQTNRRPWEIDDERRRWVGRQEWSALLPF